MAWQQVYNPLNSVALSTLFAALPVVVLLGTLAILRIKAHWAAILGLITSLVVAIGIFGMPTSMALSTAGLGAVLRPFAYMLDYCSCHFPLPAHKGKG